MMRLDGVWGSVAFRGSERFDVVGSLGEGGMGVVYEVCDRESGVHVALKTLRHASADAILRMKREFRALADLDHPNLVSLHELFEQDGQWFFTMELVRGTDFLGHVRPGSQQRSSVSPDGKTLPEPPEVEAARRRSVDPAPPAPLDVRRLRAAMVQLAVGLRALHASGRVHRDVKPSNIRVTDDGRVVLLDFGLVTDAAAPTGDTEANVVGTPAYMAPEQAASRPVGPEADWYAVGVVLYEALTGRVPYLGTPLEVLMNKQRFAPAPPDQLCDVPEDLNALCMELLRFEPSERPPGQTVLRRLGVEESEPRHVTGSSSGFTQTPPFVGRATELESLASAYADARSTRRAVTLIVSGESGIGKSALVRHFVEGLGHLVALSGRCYERENVPFKAMDGVVDALSRYLSRLPEGEAAALLPLHAAPLAQVFQVLRRVRSFAQAPASPFDVPEPNEQRSRVFGALRELFTRLCQRRSVVLVIDDLHWADGDSLALLRALLRPPDAPPLLLLATTRPIEEDPSLPGEVRSVSLSALPADSAWELASLLLARTPGVVADPALIAVEAKGHPLFIDELVRHSQDLGAGQPRVQLDDALRARIGRLDPPARRLLECIAVAGAPLPLDVVASAAGAASADRRRLVAVLRVANLVRTTAARDSIEHYHDRVQEAVVGMLDPEALRACHQDLALALETSGRADPESLLRHWEGAGQAQRAAGYAFKAAEAAALALAFDRAAELYRVALDLGSHTVADARTIRRARGDMLANAGRGAAAAAEYLDLASEAEPTEALGLRRRAAEHLLCAGHIDAGVDIVRGSLRELGVSWAENQTRAVFAVLYGRARISLRGLGYRVRRSDEIAPRILARLDALAAIVKGLALVDHIRSTDYHARYLLSALSAGEPKHLIFALTVEASFRSMKGPTGIASARALLGRIVALIGETGGDAEARARCLGVQALLAYNEGSFVECVRLCEESEGVLRAVPGLAWELSTARIFAIGSLAHLGWIGELNRRLPALVSQALDRGDHYAATFFRTISNWRYLAVDDVDAARGDLSAALASWSPVHFHFVHFWAFCASILIDLYAADGLGAWRLVEERWRDLEGSFLLRVPPMRVWALWARARAALGAVAMGASAQLLRTVERDAHWLERQGTPFVAMARLLQAQRAALQGRISDAIRMFSEAEGLAAPVQMRLCAAAARDGRGMLVGGSKGAELRAQAYAAVGAEGVRRPDRIMAAIAPHTLAAP